MFRIERNLKEATLGTRYILSAVPLLRGDDDQDLADDPLPPGYSVHRTGTTLYVTPDREMTEEEWERDRCTPF